MAKKRLSVGVIGCGDIARARHLPYWQELEAEGRVELVGACDVNKQAAREAVERFGARKAYVSYARMLNNGDYDIIDICAHNRVHCPATLAALKAGAHVLVEKPMAANVEEAKKMTAAAKRAKRKLMVAQHMRFEAGHEKLKAVIERGELGQVYNASACWLRRRGIPGWGRFHIKKHSLGGPLIDIGVHMIDLAMWLMGSPKPVAASGKVYCMFGDRRDLVSGKWGRHYPAHEFDVEDYAVAFVRFRNDITLSLDTSWAANIAQDHHGVTVLGDKGGVSTNPLGIYSYRDGALTSTQFDWLPDQEGHRMEIRHFTECVEKDRPVRVQPEESLQVQKIIDAIYESSKKNKEIVIR